MTMPDKIWARPPMHEGDMKVGFWMAPRQGLDGTPYTRSDLVSDAVKALEEARRVIDGVDDSLAADLELGRVSSGAYVFERSGEMEDAIAKIDAALNRLKEKDPTP